MSNKPELAIWPRVAGQQILFFDRCQLTITWMSNIKDKRSTRLSINPSEATLLRDVIFGRTRP